MKLEILALLFILLAMVVGCIAMLGPALPTVAEIKQTEANTAQTQAEAQRTTAETEQARQETTNTVITRLLESVQQERERTEDLYQKQIALLTELLNKKNRPNPWPWLAVGASSLAIIAVVIVFGMVIMTQRRPLFISSRLLTNGYTPWQIERPDPSLLPPSNAANNEMYINITTHTDEIAIT